MLQSLPNEALSLIFQEFAPDALEMSETSLDHYRQSWPNLASLCCTSKKLREVAETLLYRNYVKPDTLKAPLELKHIHGYMETLLRRPDLAQCVQNVAIGLWFQPGTLEHRLTEVDIDSASGDPYPLDPFFDDSTFKAFLDGEPNHGIEPSPQLLSLYRGHLAKLDIESRQQDVWYNALKEGKEDFEIALLLTLMPNVKHLQIEMPNWTYLEHPDVFPHFTRILGGHSFLQYLTSIHVQSAPVQGFNECDCYGFEDYQGYPFSFVLPFLALPSLQRAEIHSTSEANIMKEYLPHGSFSSSLKKLEFDHCAIHPRVLQEVVSRSTELEVFKCMMASSNWPWYELSKILHPHRKTLTVLEIPCLGFRPWAINETGRPRGELSDDRFSLSFGFLREYTSLQSLTINEETLAKFTPEPILHEFLPRRLEKLRITECQDSMMPMLEQLLDNVTEALPRLKELSIDQWRPGVMYIREVNHRRKQYVNRAESVARMKRLCDAYNALGVVFPYQHYDRQMWLFGLYGRF